MNVNKLSDLKDYFCHLTLKWRIFIKSVLSRDQSGFSTTEIRIPFNSAWTPNIFV